MIYLVAEVRGGPTQFAKLVALVRDAVHGAGLDEHITLSAHEGPAAERIAAAIGAAP